MHTHAHACPPHPHTLGLQAGHALHSRLAQSAGSAGSPAPSGPWGVAAHLPAETLRPAGTLSPPPPPTALTRCPAPRDYSASAAAPTPSSRQCGDKAAHTHTGATRVHTRPHTRTHGESHWRSHGDTRTRAHTPPQAPATSEGTGTHPHPDVHTLSYIFGHTL